MNFLSWTPKASAHRPLAVSATTTEEATRWQSSKLFQLHQCLLMTVFPCFHPMGRYKDLILPTLVGCRVTGKIQEYFLISATTCNGENTRLRVRPGI